MCASEADRSLRPRFPSRRAVLIGALAVATALADGGALYAQSPRRDFPTPRPVDRAQAIRHLTSGTKTPLSCLTPRLQGLGPAHRDRIADRLAASQLFRVELPGEQHLTTTDGTRVRFTRQTGAIDHLAGTTAMDDNGPPELVLAALRGIEEARLLLVGRLGLRRPDGFEIVFAELGDVQGYLAAGGNQRAKLRIVLDASPAAGADATRRAAMHQYAHAVAIASHRFFAPDWACAMATWVDMVLEGAPDPASATQIESRLADLASGLHRVDPELAAGNASWFEFLAEFYGLNAVEGLIHELARGTSPALAIEHGVNRISTDTLADALREFHLWSLLVGTRDDGRHFSFAGRIREPRFASTGDGFPTLSIQADPAVAALGATQVLLRPQESLSGRGGLRVRFEGDFSVHWDVDLVLLRADGTKHRVRLDVNDGRADHSVPLDGLENVWLLIRNLDSENGGAQRYSYSAHVEKRYPYDLASLDASPQGPRELPRHRGDDGGGILISWETASESGLVGFNILRRREDGGETVAINPVRIPALGIDDQATVYHVLDRSAKPDVGYAYRLEGVTTDGLTSVSEPVLARRQ